MCSSSTQLGPLGTGTVLGRRWTCPLELGPGRSPKACGHLDACLLRTRGGRTLTELGEPRHWEPGLGGGLPECSCPCSPPLLSRLHEKALTRGPRGRDSLWTEALHHSEGSALRGRLGFPTRSLLWAPPPPALLPLSPRPPLTPTLGAPRTLGQKASQLPSGQCRGLRGPLWPV